MERKHWNMGRRIYLFAWIFVSLLCITKTVDAAEKINQKASAGMTIQYREEGAQFRLYKVAKIASNGSFTPTKDFEKYPVKWNGLDSEGWRLLAETLDAYVARDNISPVKTLVIDENQSATAEKLEVGFYLVVGNRAAESELDIRPTPFLISLPSEGKKGTLNYFPVVNAKMTVDDSFLKDSIKRRVIKNWDDEGVEDKRPDKIEIQLLKDGEVEETVTLNKANNWSYIWEDLSGGYEWKVVEKDVPEDYTMTVNLEDKTFVVTNTATDKKTSQPPGDEHMLPQTGQLWWPVPFLALFGMGFFIIGWVRRKTLGEDDE